MTSASSPTQTNTELYLSLSVISSLLTEICEETKLTPFNAHNKPHSKLFKYFFLETIPELSLHKYLLRIASYTHIEESTLVIMLIYIDKLCSRYKLQLTYYNIYKIIAGAVLLAIKYNEDNYLLLDYYAKVCGLQLKQIKQIEYVMLCLFDYNLYINEELFEKYQRNIITIIKEQKMNDSNNNNYYSNNSNNNNRT